MQRNTKSFRIGSLCEIRQPDSHEGQQAFGVELLKEYTSNGRLNKRTILDYREAIFYYLQDWLNKPVASVTKEMVEKKFYQIREKGINRGKPTYSQVTKPLRTPRPTSVFRRTARTMRPLKRGVNLKEFQ